MLKRVSTDTDSTMQQKNTIQQRIMSIREKAERLEKL